eukprot:scaffold34887_cov221-Amphora_coffeaeformis.AAC.1
MPEGEKPSSERSGSSRSRREEFQDELERGSSARSGRTESLMVDQEDDKVDEDEEVYLVRQDY